MIDVEKMISEDPLLNSVFLVIGTVFFVGFASILGLLCLGVWKFIELIN